MITHPDTCYAIARAKHAELLRDAEHRALLREAARRPRPAPSVARSRAVTFRLDWLARAVRSLRRVPRPAHA